MSITHFWKIVIFGLQESKKIKFWDKPIHRETNMNLNRNEETALTCYRLVPLKVRRPTTLSYLQVATYRKTHFAGLYVFKPNSPYLQ